LAASLEKQLERWLSSGVLDAGTAERIRAFEQSQISSERLRWPVLLALALGGVLLCAGVLLFVAAHWDELSPAWRFSLVLLLAAAFPVAGAFTSERFPALSITFYTIGTVCVGAGIFLAAQIFNLQEHWPNGILLWAIGALAGWLLLRNWTQAALLALLVPAWLAGEWEVRTEHFQVSGRLLLEGLLLLAITYFTARTGEEDSPVRRALVWVGGILLLPLSVLAFVERHEPWWGVNRAQSPTFLLVIGWAIAVGAPLTLALMLRRSAAWANLVSAIWVLMIGTFGPVGTGTTTDSLATYAWNTLGIYFWAGVGALGLVAWGLLERQRARINLGVAGFALTVLIFYFSDVMDKLGRSASLIGMGVLLIFGGWVLERTRRQLIARVQRGAA
jgi:MFS family permease